MSTLAPERSAGITVLPRDASDACPGSADGLTHLWDDITYPVPHTALCGSDISRAPEADPAQDITCVVCAAMESWYVPQRKDAA